MESQKVTDQGKNLKVDDQGFLADFWELVRLPLALAVVAVGLTWIVWDKTTEPCTVKVINGCRSSGWGGYIDVDLLNKMFTHGGVAGGFGGIGSYVMITRERRAREAAEQRANDERQARLAAEDRITIERNRADEARKEADEIKDLYIKRLEELVDQNHNGNHASS